MTFVKFCSIFLLGGISAGIITIEDNNDKHIDLNTFYKKDHDDGDLNRERLVPKTENPKNIGYGKEKNDKVTSLLGKQKPDTSAYQNVHRITCWDGSGGARAGCIYQAPNKFVQGAVTHFWLSSNTHSIRWIHFYDANVVPEMSRSYHSDYAVSPEDSRFHGLDYVNFIVMFEQHDESAPDVPPDSEWIIYTNPEEQWKVALFSFPSNYEGNRARTNIRTSTGKFNQENIILIKFPSMVKNLHFDYIEGIQITGISEDGYAEVVTLTNIPPYIKEVWFDFNYLDSERGEGMDPIGNWFDATMMLINIY